MTTPRVLFLSPHAKSGGAERYLELLVERLGREWVAGVVTLEDGPLVERLSLRGVPTKVVATGRRPLSLLRAAIRLAGLIRTVRPDVVHANGSKAAAVALPALWRRRVPLVWVKHDFSHDGWLSLVLAARAQQVVGVSATVLERLPRRWRKRYYVVYPGVELADADRKTGAAALAEATSHPPDTPFVTLVGRLDPFKGHEELLAAVAATRPATDGVHLVFIGGADPSHPEHEARVRRVAADVGLADEVSWLGQRDDVALLLAGSRLLAVPSVGGRKRMGEEGFGLVALEAFAVGTPVVGYAGGALPEVLGDCAVMVPPRDRRALGEAIAELLEDEQRRSVLAACGRRRVAVYTFEQTVAGMKARYREACGS